ILIFNSTRVLPFRLFGSSEKGGQIELLLLKECSLGVWIATGKPLRKMVPGSKIEFKAGFRAEVLERLAEREILLQFSPPGIKPLIESDGTMPIPPYIRGGKADDQDKQDYQTIFAEVEGSIAAPTASLHFTPPLLGRL